MTVQPPPSSFHWWRWLYSHRNVWVIVKSWLVHTKRLCLDTYWTCGHIHTCMHAFSGCPSACGVCDTLKYLVLLNCKRIWCYVCQISHTHTHTHTHTNTHICTHTLTHTHTHAHAQLSRAETLVLLSTVSELSRVWQWVQWCPTTAKRATVSLEDPRGPAKAVESGPEVYHSVYVRGFNYYY